MKILMLNHELTPLGGGAGRATHHIASRLVAMGHSVDCLTTNANGTLPVEEERDGYRVLRVPGFRKSSGQNRLGPTFLSYLLFGYIKGGSLVRAEKPDVIHAFFTIPAGVLGCWLRKKYDIPLVVSLRGSDVPGHDENNTMIKRLKGLIVHVWRNSSAVVALSEGLLSLARQSDTLPSATAIHNGVCSQAFPVKDFSATSSAVLTMVCVARLERFKGIDILLEALAAVDAACSIQWTLNLVGDGPQRPLLEAQARRLGLADKVEFAGAVLPNQVAREYAKADLLVHPALSEAFGQVLTEAMSCGLPVLATRTGGIPEIINEGEQGWLVEPSSVEAFAQGLRNVFEVSRDDLEKMGKANSDFTREHFDWSQIAGQYAALYETLSPDTSHQGGEG
jgi:glycosyltransferase involved in cell wall biosynthesis